MPINRLHDLNTHGDPAPFEVGDRVWKVVDEGQRSYVSGLVEQVGGQSGKVYVRWANGIAYQEDPLWLLTRSELPYFPQEQDQEGRKNTSSIVSKFLSKKVHKAGSFKVVESYGNRTGTKILSVVQYKDGSYGVRKYKKSKDVDGSVTSSEDMTLVEEYADFSTLKRAKNKLQKLLAQSSTYRKTGKGNNHKEDCGCPICQNMNKSKEDTSEEEVDSKEASVSCPVCKSKTSKVADRFICSSESCLYEREI